MIQLWSILHTICGDQIGSTTMSDLNPNATITSIDGVSAFDSISRRAMLEELEKVLGGREVLPFCLDVLRVPNLIPVGRR